ncbi:hypothetical protein P3S38_27740, partial [Enterobacter hormaechei]|uniref:hypothetical protein n=1 Tax=Enterobacter hormaechei TaxID=158836 RepID=UPI0023E43E32
THLCFGLKTKSQQLLNAIKEINRDLTWRASGRASLLLLTLNLLGVFILRSILLLLTLQVGIEHVHLKT